MPKGRPWELKSATRDISGMARCVLFGVGSPAEDIKSADSTTDWKYWMIGKTARIGGLVPGI